MLFLYDDWECKGSLLGETGRWKATGERTVGLFEAVGTVGADARDSMGGGVGRTSGVPFAYMNLLDTFSWLRFNPGDSGGDRVVGLGGLGAMPLPLA